MLGGPASSSEMEQLTHTLEYYTQQLHGGDERDGEGPASRIGAALLRMMSVMGELSSVAYTKSSDLSPFEKDELGILIGKMLTSVALVGDAVHVNIFQATQRYVDAELHAMAARPRRQSMERERQTSTEQVVETKPRSRSPAPTAAAAEDHTRSVILSPTSNDNFFNFVDCLAHLPREAFNKANLKWIAPTPTGEIEELVPNGAAITVQHEDFPRYQSSIRRYREARAAALNAAHHSSTYTPAKAEASPYYPPRTAATAAPTSAATMAPTPPMYDRGNDANLYSPSHFTVGLFSPLSQGVSAVQPVQYAPPSAMAELSSTMPMNSNEAHHAPSTLGRIGQPYEMTDFQRKVSLLRCGIVRGPQIHQLGLTFSVPDDQRVVELVNDGMHIDVTAANAAEFLRLLDAYPNSLAPANRIHRCDSIRKLQVAQTIADVPQSFSPSHFSHDLFAPFQDKTSGLYVDYDDSQRTLPPFLKHHPQGSETRNLYVAAMKAGDIKTLESIMRQVREDATALQKYGVVFSVPSILEPYSTAADRSTGIHALFPGSAHQVVRQDQHYLFLSLARQYYKSLQ